jgi:hypothetical protein
MRNVVNGLTYCYAYLLHLYREYYHSYYHSYYDHQNQVIAQQQNHIVQQNQDIIQRDQVISQQQNHIVQRHQDIIQRDQIIYANIMEMVAILLNDMIWFIEQH